MCHHAFPGAWVDAPASRGLPVAEGPADLSNTWCVNACCMFAMHVVWGNDCNSGVLRTGYKLHAHSFAILYGLRCYSCNGIRISTGESQSSILWSFFLELHILAVNGHDLRIGISFHACFIIIVHPEEASWIQCWTPWYHSWTRSWFPGVSWLFVYNRVSVMCSVLVLSITVGCVWSRTWICVLSEGRLFCCAAACPWLHRPYSSWLPKLGYPISGNFLENIHQCSWP